MKTLGTLLVFFSLQQAHASYQTMNCSNALGSLSWTSGHGPNNVTFKTFRLNEESLVLPLTSVSIDLEEEVTLSNEVIRECGFTSRSHTFAAKATISSLKESEEILVKFLGEKVIKTVVICEHYLNSLGPCP